MSFIHINNVSFHYFSPVKEIFKDLNVNIEQTWKTGLIGNNGTGKTTLLKLISGMLEASAGNISADIPVHLCDFTIENSNKKVLHILRNTIAPFDIWEMGMKKSLNEDNIEQYGIVENLYSIHNGYIINKLIEKEIVNAGFDESVFDRMFSQLSGGEQTRLLICTMFAIDKYTIIDEPTNHLDMKGRQMLADYLNTKQGYLLVSHDRFLLNECTDHTVAFTESGFELIKGNYDKWKDQFDTRIEYERRTSENLRRDIKQLKTSFKEKVKWSDIKEKEKKGAADSGAISAQARRLMQRAKNVERRMNRAIDEKEGLLKDDKKERRLHIEDKKGRKSIMGVFDIALRIGDRQLIRNLTFSIERNEVIAITGENGTGKTLLFDILCGIRKPEKGTISRKGDITINRVSQIFPYRNRMIEDIIKEQNMDKKHISYCMNYLGIQGNIIGKNTEEFSEGEKKKFMIALSLSSNADLLLWDEPLNYLDIHSREMIEQMIFEYSPTMFLIEHDKTFINHIADDIIVIGSE